MPNKESKLHLLDIKEKLIRCKNWPKKPVEMITCSFDIFFSLEIKTWCQDCKCMLEFTLVYVKREEWKSFPKVVKFTSRIQNYKDSSFPFKRFFTV